LLCADVLVLLHEQHMLGTLGCLQAAGLHLRAARHSPTVQLPQHHLLPYAVQQHVPLLHLPAVLAGLLLVVVHLQDPATAGLHLPVAHHSPTAQQQWQYSLLLRALGAVLTAIQLGVLIGQLLVLRLLSLTGAGPHQQVLHHSQPARLHLVYHV
jgi:hypothetical protein